MLKYILAYRYAVAAGATSWIALSLFPLYPRRWFFTLFAGLWLGLIWFVLRLTRRRFDTGRTHEPLVYATMLAFISLISVIEWFFLRGILSVFGGITIGTLLFIPLHERQAPRHEQKPWRRIMMMLWVFDSYTIATALFAFGLFFTRMPLPILALAAAFIYGFATLRVWKLYFFSGPPREFILWILAISFIMLEVFWVMRFLPLGHLALGFIATWLWYLIQLLARFHLTEQGIVWKKQAWFLGVNAVLFIAVLVFVVRWI